MVSDAARFFLHTQAGKALAGLIGLLAAKVILDACVRINRHVLSRERSRGRFVFGDGRVGLTVNTVILSVIRYVTYFLLLGWILTQFGVRPSQYLASVSFVAIAVGFGTQGLVQDVVTGFFLVFERQIDVGDMVVINSQTGLVEDFGLRLTRIRLADGSRVVLPNRTIAQIVNYRTGSLMATLDLYLTGAVAADQRAALCQKALAASQRLADQFRGAVRGPVEPEPWVDQGGAGYLRMRLPLWPGQTWVVDAQWVPRVQAEAAAAGLQPAQFQLAVHYDHAGVDPLGGGTRPWPRLPHIPRWPPGDRTPGRPAGGAGTPRPLP